MKRTDFIAYLLKFIYWKRRDIVAFVTRIKMIFALWLKGVDCGTNNSFVGMARFIRYPESVISIGNNCRFNSYKKSVIGEELHKKCSVVTLNKDSAIKIGNNSGMTSGSIICSTKINIGNNVLLGLNSVVMDCDMHGSNPLERGNPAKFAKPINIHDNVFIGMNSVILKGVTIGENSTIGANSVVVTSIPPNSIALGNPCKVIFRRKS